MQAEAILRKNLENAKASLEVLVADLQILRDQVTITQVHSTYVFLPCRIFCLQGADSSKVCFTMIERSKFLVS